MYNLQWFENNIFNKLKNFNFEKSLFKDGQFGDLERVEIESEYKLATIGIWSSGWLELHIVDLNIEDEIFNVLLSPDENFRFEDQINIFYQELNKKYEKKIQ